MASRMNKFTMLRDPRLSFPCVPSSSSFSSCFSSVACIIITVQSCFVTRQMERREGRERERENIVASDWFTATVAPKRQSQPNTYCTHSTTVLFYACSCVLLCNVHALVCMWADIFKRGWILFQTHTNNWDKPSVVGMATKRARRQSPRI